MRPLATMLVLLAMAQVAMASERFVPRPDFVVAVLESRATTRHGSPAAERLHAHRLQQRHDFAGAERVLDRLLHTAPHDDTARLARASVRMIRGNFAAARQDCAQVLGSGAAEALAITCLAEARAGSGDLGTARSLLEVYPLPPGERPAVRAHLLAVRGELHERAGELDRAIADYSAALTLTPAAEPIRAALVDALAARGDAHDASALLEVQRPGLAVLVRRASYGPTAERARWREQASAWLAREAARGEALHDREVALLQLAAGNHAAALRAARANFRSQRQLVDVRLLARAAVATNDATAIEELESWLRASGFADVVTDGILAMRRRG